MKYRLYDLYECYGIVLNKRTRIGECMTLEEATKIAIEYDESCDGECDIWICEWDPETRKFLAVNAENFWLNYGSYITEVM